MNLFRIILYIIIPLLVLLINFIPSQAETAEEYVNWGNIIYANGDKVLAIQYYDSALSIDPYYIPAWLCKGHVLYQLGLARFSEALSCYYKVLEINPNNVEAKNSINVILSNPDYKSVTKNMTVEQWFSKGEALLHTCKLKVYRKY